jgi:hypothetical protein
MKRVLSLEDWAEIRRLRRADADRGDRPGDEDLEEHGERGVGRRGPLRNRRKPTGSLVDGYEPRVRKLLAAFPTMPATMIGQHDFWFPPIELPMGFGQTPRPSGCRC